MLSFAVSSILLLLAASSFGQIITTYDARTGTRVASEYPAVDISETDPIKNPDWRDMNAKFPLRTIQPPALIDVDKSVGVSITGTVRQARRDLRAILAYRREIKPTHKLYRQAWRQIQRDIARAIGLPATNGLAWGVEETYSALATVTNATTRRDYHLRTLEADLNQTRHQLERQFSQIDFWWTQEDQE